MKWISTFICILILSELDCLWFSPAGTVALQSEKQTQQCHSVWSRGSGEFAKANRVKSVQMQALLLAPGQLGGLGSDQCEPVSLCVIWSCGWAATLSLSCSPCRRQEAKNTRQKQKRPNNLNNRGETGSKRRRQRMVFLFICCIWRRKKRFHHVERITFYL